MTFSGIGFFVFVSMKPKGIQNRSSIKVLRGA